MARRVRDIRPRGRTSRGEGASDTITDLGAVPTAVTGVKRQQPDGSGLPDSGQRRGWSTGAVRDLAIGKGRFDLVPHEAIRAIALQMERGAIKYGERNWEKGIPVSCFIDSAMRHLGQFLDGRTDEPHGDAAIWNIACALATLARIEAGLLPEELNNLPHTYAAVES